MVKVEIIPRVSWSWDEFVKRSGPRSIALDGMVWGGPRYDEDALRVNFDHHDGVVREATMSTAMQVLFALKGGLMDRFAPATVYVNDTDQDTALAVWLLEKHALFEGTKSIPTISRLLALTDRLDITGGAFPMDLDDRLVCQHNWVFEPYTDLRKTGGLASATAEVLRDNLEAVTARLDRFMMGAAGEVELDRRHEILDRLEKPPCWIVDELGGNHARYALYAQGMPAFLAIVTRRPDGRTVYSIGRRSRYINFPLPRIYEAINAVETSGGKWGGSDIIGGAPRVEGSALSWEQIRDVLRSL